METALGFFTGSSIGYFMGRIFGGPETGGTGLISSLVFRLGDVQLHFHHWLFSFCILILLFSILFFKKREKLSSLLFVFIFGFLGGLIFQGIISYDDWHQILIKIN